MPHDPIEVHCLSAFHAQKLWDEKWLRGVRIGTPSRATTERESGHSTPQKKRTPNKAVVIRQITL
jgi:hypothetical protein